MFLHLIVPASESTTLHDKRRTIGDFEDPIFSHAILDEMIQLGPEWMDEGYHIRDPSQLGIRPKEKLHLSLLKPIVTSTFLGPAWSKKGLIAWS